MTLGDNLVNCKFIVIKSLIPRTYNRKAVVCTIRVGMGNLPGIVSSI